MLIQENSLIEYIEKLKEKKLVVDMVTARCYAEKTKNTRKEDTIVFFEGIGTEALQTDEYYENVEMSLFQVLNGWLGEFFNLVKQPWLRIYIPIDELDGMASDNIRMEVKIIIPGAIQNDPHVFVMEQFKVFSMFNKQIVNVEFSGNKHCLQHIQFHIQISTRDIMKNIRKLTPNSSSLYQWTSIYDGLKEFIEKDYRFYYNIPVVNGKMSPDMGKQKHCGKFVNGKMVVY